MSSLFKTNLKRRKDQTKEGKRVLPAREQKRVPHAAYAHESLKECQSIKEKDAKRVSVSSQHHSAQSITFASSCCFSSMVLLCLLKDRRIIAIPADPHGIDDTDPDICQGSQSHTVGFPL